MPKSKEVKSKLPTELLTTILPDTDKFVGFADHAPNLFLGPAAQVARDADLQTSYDNAVKAIKKENSIPKKVVKKVKTIWENAKNKTKKSSGKTK
jgi:hypothetical protein